MRAEGVLRRDRRPELALLGQRERRDFGQPVRVDARELLAVALVIQGELLGPGQPLCVSHAGTRSPPPPSRPAGSRGGSPAPRPDGLKGRLSARGSEGPAPP